MDKQTVQLLVEDLLAISAYVGSRPDYVQGGGGNTSAKHIDGLMAIKASGFELRQLAADQGFAFVESRPVTAFFKQLTRTEIDLDSTVAKEADNIPSQDYEALSGHVVQANTIVIEPYPAARPSMETGFHSLLDRYVIHTHSVYSNLLNCSMDAASLLARFNSQFGYQAVLIPYYNPGFWLTTAIMRLRAADTKVFFLQNHGLIVIGNDQAQVVALHEQVNADLQVFFDVLPDDYPAADILEVDEAEGQSVFVSNSALVKQFVSSANRLDAAYFEKHVLFPDQTVFFNGNFCFTTTDPGKILVDQQNGQVYYRTNFREARTIDETLTAYLYIRQQLARLGQTPRFLTESDLNYINNMESERFRKSLLK